MEHRIRLLIFFLSISLWAGSINYKAIGEKIYHNECASNPKNLVHWNRGENFPSLGIGHFIWYPKGVKERFEESFPAFIAYYERYYDSLPSWLKESAPWQGKAQMLADKRSKKLRYFLEETKSIQAAFMAERLQSLTYHDSHVKTMFKRVARDEEGYYLLIDYRNFKGTGLNTKERYRDKGWGLKQVLECMRGAGNARDEFASCAKKVLTLRVKNSPKERNEKRWLKGWLNRIKTYNNYK